MNEPLTHYSVVARLFHWLTLPVVLGLFGLGLWMTDLDYYHAWYKRAPDLHRSIGFVLLMVTGLRLCYRWYATYPKPLPQLTKVEKTLSRAMHIMMYAFILALGVSGYLITTAKGAGLVVFNLIEIPSLLKVDQMEDVAGEIHEVLAFLFMAFIALHAGAALKHHFVKKDHTLIRMICNPKHSKNL